MLGQWVKNFCCIRGWCFCNWGTERYLELTSKTVIIFLCLPVVDFVNSLSAKLSLDANCILVIWVFRRNGRIRDSLVTNANFAALYPCFDNICHAAVVVFKSNFSRHFWSYWVFNYFSMEIFEQSITSCLCNKIFLYLTFPTSPKYWIVRIVSWMDSRISWRG